MYVYEYEVYCNIYRFDIVQKVEATECNFYSFPLKKGQLRVSVRAEKRGQWELRNIW